LEASTTKVSSKGQVVIPMNVRRAARVRKGERLLAIALGDSIILKKLGGRTFEETVRPVWERARQLGLTEEEIDAVIEEAKAESSP
jgi:AbrB family looped-hinge helix DNA binding protein